MFTKAIFAVALAFAFVACGGDPNEPEVPLGYQMVVKPSAGWPASVSLTKPQSWKDLTSLEAGLAWSEDIEADTVYIGFLVLFSSEGDEQSVMMGSSLKLSPTTEHPIALHDFVAGVAVSNYNEKTGMLVPVSESVEILPAANNSFKISYRPSVTGSRRYYSAFFVRGVTCEKEGRNVLQVGDLEISLLGSWSVKIPLPTITVTCHRAVSSASVRANLP